MKIAVRKETVFVCSDLCELYCFDGPLGPYCKNCLDAPVFEPLHPGPNCPLYNSSEYEVIQEDFNIEENVE